MTTNKQVVDFLNKFQYHQFQILANDHVFIDNGGGSDDDFVELGVSTLIDIVKKVYVRGLADGLK